jgi:hypothetical protein
MERDEIVQLINSMLLSSQYRVPTVPYHIHNNIDAPFIPFTNLENNPNNFCVAAITTGTTAVPVFGDNGAKADLTITGAFLTALDTTAGTISVINNRITIATMAKGTTAGVMVGATNLSTGTLATYTRGNPLTIVSSSVGNAIVYLVFTA